MSTSGYAPAPGLPPLVILDRDGVINVDSAAYIKSPDEWQPIPGSLAAIARLNRAGSQVAVASNQSGLARALFEPATLEAIHAKMRRELAAVGGHLDALAFCPHGPYAGCACRKPKPGLFYTIAEQLGRDLAGVPAIGDSARDLQAASAVGAVPILVLTGKGEATRQAGHYPANTRVYPDLAAAVDALLEKERLP